MKTEDKDHIYDLLAVFLFGIAVTAFIITFLI